MANTLVSVGVEHLPQPREVLSDSASVGEHMSHCIVIADQLC